MEENFPRLRKDTHRKHTEHQTDKTTKDMLQHMYTPTSHRSTHGITIIKNDNFKTKCQF